MWDSLTIIQTSNTWQYSPVVIGRVFRLRHVTNAVRPQDLRAVIGQSFKEGNVEMFYNTSRLSYKPEVEIFEFNQPGEFLERTLAIKRLDNLPDTWTIKIEALDAVFIPVQTDDLSLEFSKIQSVIILGVI